MKQFLQNVMNDIYADVFSFEEELHREMEKIVIMEELPSEWTYPDIQPKLLEKARQNGFV